MSSFSDCAVEPEPGPVPLRRLSAAVPLRPRLLLASMLAGGCCFSVLSPVSRPDHERGPPLFILDRSWALKFFLVKCTSGPWTMVCHPGS
jgi:hypothetical protein